MYDQKEEIPSPTTTAIATNLNTVTFIFSSTQDIGSKEKLRYVSLDEAKVIDVEHLQTSQYEDTVATPIISNRPNRVEQPPLLSLPQSIPQFYKHLYSESIHRLEGESQNPGLQQGRFSSDNDEPITMSNSTLDEWKHVNTENCCNKRPMECSNHLQLLDLFSKNTSVTSVSTSYANVGIESLIRIVFTFSKNQLKRKLYQQNISGLQGISMESSHQVLKSMQKFDKTNRLVFSKKSMRSSHLWCTNKTYYPMKKVFGIPNYGQTCFLNSVLQSLASLDPFIAYLERIVQFTTDQHNFLHTTSSLYADEQLEENLKYQKHPFINPNYMNPELSQQDPLLCQLLLDTIRLVNGQQQSIGCIDPRPILNAVGRKYSQFKRRFGLSTCGDQQDAQEFLQAVIGIVADECQFNLTSFAAESVIVSSFVSNSTDEWNDSRNLIDMPKQNSPLDNPPSKAMEIMMTTSSSISPSPLSVWFGSTLMCTTCRRVRPIQNVPFLNIPVIPTSISNYLSVHPKLRSSETQETSCRLEVCLEEFTSVERVHDVECRHCTIQGEIRKFEMERDVQMQILEGLTSRRNKKTGSATVKSQMEESIDRDEFQHFRDDLSAIESRIEILRLLSPDDDKPIYNFMPSNQFVDEKIPTQEKIILKRSDAFKCFLITRLPSILSIHVQRRYYDPITGRTSKTMQHVIFPETLDVSPYCAYGGRSGPCSSFAGVFKDEATNSSRLCNRIPIWYKLMVVIEHRGGPNSGHYICYRRDPSVSNRWLWISDNIVRSCQWSDVRNCQAYMLFYEAM